MSQPALELERLARSWDGVPALHELSLSLQPGRTIGLIGPDGAGKTTALRIACGLLAADGGHARVFGFDSTTQTDRIRDLLGYMPQRFSLYPDLSTLELRFFLDETEMGLVAPGQTLSITVDAFPDETLQGRVSWISSRAEFTPKNVQTRQARSQLVYAVKATLDNPDGRLQIGMPAQVLLDARP